MAQIYEKFKFPVRHDEKDYARMVFGLLPKGVIWGVERFSYALEWIDTIWSSDVKTDTVGAADAYQDVISGSWSGGKLALLLSVIGSELSRIEEDAWDILNGTDPGVTTGDFLADWERNLGLPDSCTGVSPTVEERQIAAHAKLFAAYVSTTLQAYIDFADSIGYTITIDELPDDYQPRICGVSRCGYQRLGGYGSYSILEITVTAGDGTMDFFECKMNKFKPAHAYIVYVDARP